MKRPHPRAFLRRKYTVRANLVKFPRHEGRRRIAIITGQLAAGGVERVLLNIVNGLPSDKFDITIYITDFNNNTWMDRFSKRCNIVHVTKQLNWSNDEAIIVDFVAKSILANKDDVVFITNSTAGYKALPKIYHKNRDVATYDLLHTYGTPAEDDAFLKISQPYDTYLNTRIVISDYLKKYLNAKYGISNERILVIRNGIPTGSLNSKYSQIKGREILGNENKRAITYMGRLQADKSPERLVAVANQLRDTLNEQRAFIAIFGDGELRDQLESESKKLGILNDTIRFYGQTDDPLSVMSASYFTILTSNLEGVPMSVLESMNVGTPAIAPNVGGIPEIIQGESGILIDFAESNTEKEKMLHLGYAVTKALNLKHSDFTAMKKNARRVIERDFSHMEKDYLQLFTYGTTRD